MTLGTRTLGRKSRVEILKQRYRNFGLFIGAGMNEDEAAICSLLSEADEIAKLLLVETSSRDSREMGTDEVREIRKRLVELQSFIAARSVKRRVRAMIEVAGPERVGERIGDAGAGGVLPSTPADNQGGSS